MMLRKNLKFAIIALAVGVIVLAEWSCREPVACSLRSGGGVEVQISIVVSDDSGVDYVRGRFVNRRGRVLDSGVSLGFTQEPINCSVLGIYESGDGEVVALFHRDHPRSLIALLDLKSGRVFSSDETDVEQEIRRPLRKLSDDLQIPLQYEGPYSFTRQRFL